MLKKIIIAAAIFLWPAWSNAQVPQVKHVILIGIDGLGAYCFPNANIPNIKKMMQEGAYALHARCVLPSSSALNWASMTMGAAPELHGFTKSKSEKPEVLPRDLDQYNLFPSIFSILREQQPEAEIGAVYTWGGINNLLPKQALNFNEYGGEDHVTIEKAITYLKEKKPDFLFIQLDEVDRSGHRHGHNTPMYYKQVTKTDENIGKLLKAVKEAGIWENTMIILTADHGGLHKKHGGKTMQEMEIPWVIFGPGVKKNHEIAESIMTYDTAVTIAFILQLKVPQVWMGRPVMSVFE